MILHLVFLTRFAAQFVCLLVFSLSMLLNAPPPWELGSFFPFTKQQGNSKKKTFDGAHRQPFDCWLFVTPRHQSRHLFGAVAWTAKPAKLVSFQSFQSKNLRAEIGALNIKDVLM